MRLKENKCYSLQSGQDSNRSWQLFLKSSPKFGEERKMFTSDLRHWTFLCNRAEITELALGKEEEAFPLLLCAFDIIGDDILQLN